MLETAVAGIEARFAVDPAGRVRWIDLWTAPDADPCEVRFGYVDNEGEPMPVRMEVRRGTEPFGRFTIESQDVAGAAP